MWGCFENPFVNDTSLDPRPLPSLHMRRRYSALSFGHVFNSSEDSKLHCGYKTMFLPLLKVARVFIGFVSF